VRGGGGHGCCVPAGWRGKGVAYTHACTRTHTHTCQVILTGPMTQAGIPGTPVQTAAHDFKCDNHSRECCANMHTCVCVCGHTLPNFKHTNAKKKRKLVKYTKTHSQPILAALRRTIHHPLNTNRKLSLI